MFKKGTDYVLSNGKQKAKNEKKKEKKNKPKPCFDWYPIRFIYF